VTLARASLVLALTAWVACDTTEPRAAPRACTDVQLIVAASDYSSSVVCGAPGCALGPGTTGADLGKDPQLTSSNGRTFFLARDNDLLFELDPACGSAIARTSVHDLAKEQLANPHDVAAAPDGTLFLPLYNVPRIAIVKDGRIDGSIDLASYDPDGNPQADAVRVVAVNGVAKAFVTLERLDDKDLLRSKQSSQMLRIDVATRTVEAVIELAGRNPFNPMAEEGGALFLAEPGNFDAADEDLAGIERFETSTSTSKLLVPERTLGGSVAEVAVTRGCGVAIVAGPQKDVNPTSLKAFDPTTGAVLGTILEATPGYDLQGLAWRDNTLFVGDRRAQGTGYRVHVFERDEVGCVLRSSPRSIDLPQRPVALRAAK